MIGFALSGGWGPESYLKTVNVIVRSVATKQSQSGGWEIASRSLPHSAIAQSEVEWARNDTPMCGFEIVSEPENALRP